MARNIAADDHEIWRAVMVYRDVDGMEYVFKEGAYANAGTAKARITYNRGGYRRVPTNPNAVPWSSDYTYTHVSWVDGWIERGTVSWERA